MFNPGDRIADRVTFKLATVVGSKGDNVLYVLDSNPTTVMSYGPERFRLMTASPQATANVFVPRKATSTTGDSVGDPVEHAAFYDVGVNEEFARTLRGYLVNARDRHQDGDYDATGQYIEYAMVSLFNRDRNLRLPRLTTWGIDSHGKNHYAPTTTPVAGTSEKE
jgi:hypothetical protein